MSSDERLFPLWERACKHAENLLIAQNCSLADIPNYLRTYLVSVMGLANDYFAEKGENNIGKVPMYYLKAVVDRMIEIAPEKEYKDQLNEYYQQVRNCCIEANIKDVDEAWQLDDHEFFSLNMLGLEEEKEMLAFLKR